MTDREFMSLIEKQILEGEPSVDPIVRDGLSPEGAVAQHLADQLYVDGNPQSGYNTIVDNKTFR
jgi:hypothetical protein